MDILVTGHEGFIGGHMLKALRNLGHNVSTYEYTPDEYPSLAGLEWVIHMGAISSTTETDVEKVMRQNFDFTKWLIDECEYHEVNLQYSSSASIYGLGANFNEEAAPDPKSPYAWSKYLIERHIDELGDSPNGLLVQGFRYFNVYGPEGEEHKGNQASPFYQFKKQAETGKISVFEGSDEFRRDFIHVDEIVKLHLKFLDIPENGIWNFGTGKTLSFMDVAQSFGVPIEVVPFPPHLKHSYQSYTCADLTKLNTTLGKYDD